MRRLKELADPWTDSSTTRLTRFEERTEWALAAVAVLFLLIYSVKVLAQPQAPWSTALDDTLWGIWGVFVVHYLARLCLAHDRLRWFGRHLFDFAIVVLPILRPLRLLRLVVLVTSLERVIGGAVRGKVVVYTAFSALLLVYAGALAILEAERHHVGTQINTLGAALWWSICTITTVGYGDQSDVSSTGRLIAAVLMIGGIGLIGTVTATLASWIVQRVAQEDNESHAEMAAQIEGLRDELRLHREELRDAIQLLQTVVSSQRQHGEPTTDLPPPVQALELASFRDERVSGVCRAPTE